jgi:hypothetical protein
MNTEFNKVLAAKSDGQPRRISSPMKEFQNLRQLPGTHHE